MISIPVLLNAAPAKDTPTISAEVELNDSSLGFTAGKITSGNPEAVLQLDKTVVRLLSHSLLKQIHPEHFSTSAVPVSYRIFIKVCSLNSILTKGP
ncbi:hypothetical protein ACFSRY_12995 [Pontibacter locisalis]|uniref:Uncharacterized protein n=1 Tax=Pontibacter locisalis TaxID=1719035 RepID=A0ABW5IMZ7_9BACT